ncbi:helix-turn-helix transcriptional regulator [Colwelliaceae bacterium BS250]
MDVSCFSGQQYSINEYDEAFSAYQITNIPLGKCPLIDVNWIHNDEFIILERQNNVSMMQYGVSTDAEFIINLPSYNKQAMDAYFSHGESTNQGFLATPNQDCYWNFKAHVKTINFSLKVDAIKRHLTENEIDCFIEKAKFNKRVDLSFENLKKVSYLTSQLIQKSLTNNLSSEEANSELERIAMYALLLPELETTFRRSRSKGTFTNALDFIRENYKRKISVTDIANSANTTVRSLQSWFKSELNKTPVEYLNLVRIYHFHLLLQNSRSISESARMCGLTHMGRVSMCYKAIFGISPTEFLATSKPSDLLSWDKDKKLLKFIG